jgi:hypothetical protein
MTLNDYRGNAFAAVAMTIAVALATTVGVRGDFRKRSGPPDVGRLIQCPQLS